MYVGLYGGDVEQPSRFGFSLLNRFSDLSQSSSPAGLPIQAASKSMDP